MVLVLLKRGFLSAWKSLCRFVRYLRYLWLSTVSKNRLFFKAFLTLGSSKWRKSSLIREESFVLKSLLMLNVCWGEDLTSASKWSFKYFQGSKFQLQDIPHNYYRLKNCFRESLYWFWITKFQHGSIVLKGLTCGYFVREEEPILKILP